MHSPVTSARSCKRVEKAYAHPLQVLPLPALFEAPVRFVSRFGARPLVARGEKLGRTP